MKSKIKTTAIFFALMTLQIFSQNFGEISFRNLNDGLVIIGDRTNSRYSLKKTTDGGNSWSEILSARYLKGIARPTNNSIIVGYNYTGIALSNDGGNSWSFLDLDEGRRVVVKKIDFLNSNYGWVLGTESLYITTDGGTNWESISLPGFQNGLSVDIQKMGLGWIVNEDGFVLKYDAANQDWLDIGKLGGTCYGDNAGITFIDSTNGIAVGYTSSYLTDDGGMNWSLIPQTKGQHTNGYHYLNKDSLWLCGDRGISFSENGGESFKTQYSDPVSIRSIDFVDNKNGWAVNDFGQIIKTTDSGNKWINLQVADGYSPVIEKVEDRPNDEGGVVILKFKSSILESGNQTEILNEYQIYKVINSYPLYYKSVSPNNQLSYNIEVESMGDSTATGIEWSYFQVRAVTLIGNEYLSSVKRGYSVDNINPNPPDSLRGVLNTNVVNLNWNSSTSADVYTYQIYRSFDGTFSNIPYDETIETNFEDTNILTSGYDKVYYKVIAVDSSGNLSEFSNTIEISLITTDVNEESKELKFDLSQNYPNPFNPSTIISFSIPQSLFVTIKIYDNLGEEVKTLLNENLNSGNHQITFDAQGLPSGVYFYRMTAGKYTKSYKMILLK